MLFRGYLPIMNGGQMAQFFNSSNIRYREWKPFLLDHAACVKQHGVDWAEKEGRPFPHLQEKVNKDDLARQIAERDHIEDGLIGVLSVLELPLDSEISLRNAEKTQIKNLSLGRP